ncbi:MAG: ABC transporter permease [Lachnospiraceae bacterium]|jgi:ABC-2 type transport system permease protein|nr:ABC transporter permease [Lachnospiraceae bacterium]
MNDTLHLMTVYSKTTARAWFQYRVDAVLRSLAVFARESTGIIVIYFTLLKFNSLNGWNIYELLFLYSLIFLTYGIMIIFFTGLRDFGNMVREGSFDRFVLRPRGILFQIIFVNSDWFAAIGHGGLGITLFLISAGKVGVHWNIYNALYYLFAVIGGVLIQGAVFLFIATLNIYLIETGSIKELLYWNVRKFAGYPISIFNKGVQFLMIYIMPYAFVNYFPAQFLLRKEDMSQYPEIYLYLTPIVGVGMYLLAYAFWLYSLKYYKSSGN